MVTLNIPVTGVQAATAARAMAMRDALPPTTPESSSQLAIADVVPTIMNRGPIKGTPSIEDRKQQQAEAAKAKQILDKAAKLAEVRQAAPSPMAIEDSQNVIRVPGHLDTTSFENFRSPNQAPGSHMGSGFQAPIGPPVGAAASASGYDASGDVAIVDAPGPGSKHRKSKDKDRDRDRDRDRDKGTLVLKPRGG